MTLPVPEKSASQARLPEWLIKLATLSLVVALVVFLAVLGGSQLRSLRERESARKIQFTTTPALRRALEIYHDLNSENRGDGLTDALEILNEEVLSVDKANVFAVATRDQIQEELRSIQNETIRRKDEITGQREVRIGALNQQVSQARGEISTTRNQITRLTQSNNAMNRERAQALQAAAQAEKEAEQARGEAKQARGEAEEVKREAAEAKQAADARIKELERILDLLKRGTVPLPRNPATTIQPRVR